MRFSTTSYQQLMPSSLTLLQEKDLEQFRQWASSTTGYPENFETLGVKITSGSLGPGIANADGLALDETTLINWIFIKCTLTHV
ncbi:hypothetical protein BDA96_02G109300 [Sorghum bicolor]|uniref:Transketolase N-terminal domain-containing protein n=1 Tax=Sorghum bicolor TaxID=4558 RepID=A0A921RP55_SORBI|nr:hypothetical protein BDA96_02G109300 [Sorghum bicolor]